MKKWMYTTLILVFAAVLAVSGGVLIFYYADASQQANRYEQLSDLRQFQTPRPDPTVSDVTVPAATEPAMVEVTDPRTGQTLSILPEFEELFRLNPDIAGWLTIPGTNIDYPVMHTPDRPDYYLRRNFDQKHNTRGCLYAREQCDLLAPSDNITLYGHRMKDGSMFAALDNYTDPSFRDANPYIYFDTLQSLHTYEVMAVFLTTSTVGEGFAYHEFVQAEDAGDFDAFVARCKALSLYDTGVTAQYGDKLITLSTCEYSQTNGRLVVVAKRIA